MGKRAAVAVLPLVLLGALCLVGHDGAERPALGSASVRAMIESTIKRRSAPGPVTVVPRRSRHTDLRTRANLEVLLSPGDGACR